MNKFSNKKLSAIYGNGKDSHNISSQSIYIIFNY